MGYGFTEIHNKNVFDLPLKHNSDNNIKVIQNNTKGSSYDRVNEQGERKGEQSPDFGRNKSAKDTIEINDNPSQQIKENKSQLDYIKTTLIMLNKQLKVTIKR